MPITEVQSGLISYEEMKRIRREVEIKEDLKETKDWNHYASTIILLEMSKRYPDSPGHRGIRQSSQLEIKNSNTRRYFISNIDATPVFDEVIQVEFEDNLMAGDPYKAEWVGQASLVVKYHREGTKLK